VATKTAEEDVPDPQATPASGDNDGGIGPDPHM
jgi:hypothetical protein